MLTSINGESLVGLGNDAVCRQIERLDLTTSRGASLGFAFEGGGNGLQHGSERSDDGDSTHNFAGLDLNGFKTVGLRARSVVYAMRSLNLKLIITPVSTPILTLQRRSWPSTKRRRPTE